MKIIRSTVDFNDHIRTHKGVLFYFATTSCSVGEALEPKVQKLLIRNIPKLEYCSIDMNLAAELSAAHQVFVEPTILLFLEGKEFLRKSRHIGLVELDMSIGRIYDLAFE